MKNQILSVDNTFAKSIVLKNEELWVSTENVSSLEKFEKAVQKTGMLQSAYSVPCSSITEVSYNEASDSTKIKYINEKGKEKKLNLNFGDATLSNQFGQYLGDQLNLTKTSVQESQIKPLLLNALYLLIAVGVTIFLGTMDDTASLTESSSRKSRNRGAFLKLIVDTIGQTGVFIVGGLASAYFAYQLYNRFKNPSNEVVYSK